MNDRFKAIWYYYNKIDEVSKFKLIKDCLSMTFLEDYKFEYNEGNSENICFISKMRNDYIELLEKIISQNRGNMTFIKGDVIYKKKNVLKSIRAVFSFTEFFQYTNKMRMVDEYCNEDMRYVERKLSFLERIHLYLFYVAKANAIRSLEEKGYFHKIKNLVLLSDVWPVEQILIDRLKSNKDVKVIVGQHGLYLDDYAAHDPGKYNFIELPSDVYLLWGESSKIMFQKYNPGLDVRICGNPIIDTHIHCSKNEKIWAIVLDIPRLHKYNQEMISIVSRVARERGIKIKIRLHPQEINKTQTYDVDPDICSFTREIDDASVIFGHTTTMIFTYLLKGYPTFKYLSDVKCFDMDKDFVFSNDTDLRKIIGLKNIDLIKKEASNKIAVTGDDSLRLYTDEITKLIGLN